MPSATVGPVPLKEPPRALIPLTVGNSRAVSKSQTIWPSLIRNARRCPSIDPENTRPGTAVGGASCAALQPRWPAQGGLGGGVCHTTLPLDGSRANRPPGSGDPMSESGANTSPSGAAILLVTTRGG